VADYADADIMEILVHKEDRIALFRRVCGLSAGAVARVASTGTPVCFRDLGRASGPSGGMGPERRSGCEDTNLRSADNPAIPDQVRTGHRDWRLRAKIWRDLEVCRRMLNPRSPFCLALLFSSLHLQASGNFGSASRF
jgi:hypothetical protein